MTDWCDELPKECPPKEAYDPNGKKVFRLCKQSPANEEDFLTHRKLFPNKKYPDECICRSLSVMDSKEAAESLLKTPIHKGKLIGELVLSTTDGLICKTFGPGHYSWWRTKQFKLDSVKIIQ